MSNKLTFEELAAENDELRLRLDQAEETLRAITSGEVDALVVNTKDGEKTFTIEGADSVYRTAIENISEGAVTLSPGGMILYSNGYFASMMRIGLHKLIGASIFDFISPEDQKTIAAILGLDRGRLEVALKAADGARIPTYISTIKLPVDTITICAIITDLTQQEQNKQLIKAQKELSESEERFRTLNETSPIGVGVSSTDGVLLYANSSYGLILGYDQSELIGRKAADLYWDPDDRLSWMNDMKASGAVRDVETRLKRKDGTPVWVSINASPILYGGKQAVMGTIQDITERKKADDALKESEQRANALIKYAPTGIYEIDFNGAHFLSINDAVSSLTGYTREELFALGPSALLDEESRKLFADRIKHKLGGEQIDETVEYKVKKKDGSLMFVTLNISFSKERPGTALVIGHDVTERRKSEEELKRKSAELEASNKELEAFSYSVSHDLGAPLRSMHGFSGAMLEDYSNVLDEKGKQYLKYIQESSELMDRLIADLLRLSRIARSEMEYDSVSLTELATDIMLKLKSSEPGRKTEINIAPGMLALGDRDLINLALENLLGNAWKFTGKNGLTRVEMGITESRGKQAFFIRDNGAGFDMNYADRLFLPFQRLHRVTDFPGNGIGLATVQRVIRRHGGEVWAEGKVDEGATFYFTLG
jgi:PAS domain S-box-containing protein